MRFFMHYVKLFRKQISFTFSLINFNFYFPFQITSFSFIHILVLQIEELRVDTTEALLQIEKVLFPEAKPFRHNTQKCHVKQPNFIRRKSVLGQTGNSIRFNLKMFSEKIRHVSKRLDYFLQFLKARGILGTLGFLRIQLI